MLLLLEEQQEPVHMDIRKDCIDLAGVKRLEAGTFA